MYSRQHSFTTGPTGAYRCPKCSRIVIYLVHKRNLIFPLLLVNLGFFVVMYVFALNADGQTQDLSGSGGITKRMKLHAGEFQLDPMERRERSQGLSSGAKQQSGRERRFRYSNRIQEDSKACETKDRSPPTLDSPSPRWYSVFLDSNRTFVYSAYFDNRDNEEAIGPVIRIIGMSFGFSENGWLYCQIWYRRHEKPDYVRAKYIIVPETHDYRYAPAMYECNTQDGLIPYAVSLTSSKCATPHYYLPVVTKSQKTLLYKNTVCLSPLNMHYDDIHSFVENVEINRLMGADRIVVYNNTSGERLNHYLHHYVRTGLIDLVQWQLPVNVHTDPPDPLNPPEIHYFGQVVALNDCLYRYMYQTKYIVYTDLDEVIVPRKGLDWNDMMINLTKIAEHKSEKTPCAFMFRNTFFRIDWADDEVYSDHDMDQKLRLRTQLKLKRESKVWDYYSRSKHIVVPENAVMIGIHFVFQCLDAHVSHFMVPPNVALLHHYREWGDEGSPPADRLDPYMRRFRHKLRRTVTRTHNAVKVLPHIVEPKKPITKRSFNSRVN